MNTTDNTILSNEILLTIFDCVSIVQRKRLTQVCHRWKALIERSFLCLHTYSTVDDRRCVTDWTPSNWLSIKFVSQSSYIRIPGVSATEVLLRLIKWLPNVRALDLECCDLNTRTVRTILDSYVNIERINLDSSTRLNFCTFNLIVSHWNKMRHINVSCCTDVSETSASLIIKNLPLLESLNLCGTHITGECLEHLGPQLRRLDISYCWRIQEAGLMSLARCRAHDLIELSINTFDLDAADTCLIAIVANFNKLKHLQMSIGPCVALDYFVDKMGSRGFSALCNLTQLETLIIEKVCIMDDQTLSQIFNSCRQLKHLNLNLGWINFCTDAAFSTMGANLRNLETLSISYPSSLSTNGLTSLPQLTKLKSLTLKNTNVNNQLFKLLENLNDLTYINLDDCRLITMRGLNQLCRIVKKRPDVKMTVSLLGTGIVVARIAKVKRQFPSNLFGQISNFRATKYHLKLPINWQVQQPLTQLT